MTIRAFGIAAGRRLELAQAADVPTTLPAGSLVIEIQSDVPWQTAKLDGSTMPLIEGATPTTSLLIYDAFSSVGYHRLEVGRSVFIFATEDAKLQIAGIEEILDYLGTEGLSWGSQLFFSSGERIRDPRVDFAWLESRGPEIVEVARAIAERPFHRVEVVPRRGRPRGGRLFRAATLSLIRRDPKGLLEPTADGPLEINNQRYAPRQVIQGKAVRSADLTSNRRVAWLLTQTRSLAYSIRELLPARKRSGVTELAVSCSRLLARAPFVHPDLRLDVALPAQPAREECVDPRYIKAFEIFHELRSKLGWEPGTTVASRFSYVRSADEIYQAFVALTLAKAFDAAKVPGPLMSRLPDPVFRSSQYEIYYDTVPPTDIFANWRDKSSRPSEMRPDLVIVDRERRVGVLVDAKYRVESSGQLTSTGLSDCQVYMQSFGTNNMVVCYPGSPLRLQNVAGAGNCILQVPVRPSADLAPFLREVARPAILELIRQNSRVAV